MVRPDVSISLLRTEGHQMSTLPNRIAIEIGTVLAPKH